MKKQKKVYSEFSEDLKKIENVSMSFTFSLPDILNQINVFQKNLENIFQQT